MRLLANIFKTNKYFFLYGSNFGKLCAFGYNGSNRVSCYFVVHIMHRIYVCPYLSRIFLIRPLWPEIGNRYTNLKRTISWILILYNLFHLFIKRKISNIFSRSKETCEITYGIYQGCATGRSRRDDQSISRQTRKNFSSNLKKKLIYCRQIKNKKKMF